MTPLTNMSCVACRPGSPRVTDDEMAELRAQVPEWHVVEHEGERRLERTFRFPTFNAALAFTGKVGKLAEAEGHHPMLLTEWGRVTVTWWTHTIGGLHRNDFIMAAKTSQLYEQSGTALN